MSFSLQPLSIDQIRVRLDRASEVRSLIRDMQWNPRWEYTAYHASALALLPSTGLDHFFTADPYCTIVVEQRLIRLSWATRHFVLGRHHDDVNLIVRSFPAVEDATLKCQQRDGHVCILTGRAVAEVAPILPLSWSRDGTPAAVTASVLQDSEFLINDGRSNVADLVSRLGQIGATHHPWNMISLDHRLIDLWRKGFFGLEWAGSTTLTENEDTLAMVILRFHWLLREAAKPSRPVDDPTLDRIMRQACSHDGEFSRAMIVKDIRLPSGTPIQSGHTISINMPASDLPGFEAMIRLQWALACMAALSGAAEDVNVDGGGAEEYNRWIEAASRWLEKIPDLPERFDDGLEVRDGGRVVLTRTTGGLKLDSMTTVMKFD